MIEKDKFYRKEADFNELTYSELRAFKVFLEMELDRHVRDIDHIAKCIEIIDKKLRGGERKN